MTTSAPVPTESTPLSHSDNQIPSYQAAHPANLPTSSSSPSSSDSGGGYVSGSGRRASALDVPRRKNSRIPPARRIPSDHGNPLSGSGSIQWAAATLDADSPSATGLARTQSPGLGVSPGRKSSFATTGTTDSEGRRRRSSLKPADVVTGPSRKSSRRFSRDTGERNGKESEGGWFHDLAEKYGAIELDNKGSVARDHLALERTFLAWLRTSLAFASIGIGITQLFRLNTTLNPGDSGTSPQPPSTSPVLQLRSVGKPLGTTFLGISIVILCLGWRRYFEAQYWIIRGKFPASRGSVFLVSFIATSLIVVSLVVVVIVGRST